MWPSIPWLDALDLVPSCFLVGGSNPNAQSLTLLAIRRLNVLVAELSGCDRLPQDHIDENTLRGLLSRFDPQLSSEQMNRLTLRRAIGTLEALRIRQQPAHVVPAAAATPDGSATLAQDVAAAAAGEAKLSLDAQALAVFIEHTDWAKKKIAAHLKCNEKSLSPKRCPKLAAAISAHKAKIDPGTTVRGFKGKDRRLDAWEDE